MTAASKAFALVAAVFFICFEGFGDDTNDVSAVFGGRDVATIIARPDSVKAWRTLGSIEIEQYLHKYEHGKRFDFNPGDEYRKSGDPIFVANDLAAQLSKALLEKNNYNSIGTSWKKCDPEPGVVVTFSEGDKSVDVFFCFECNILVVNHVDSDFDRGYKTFVRIIKKIFPNDQTIQSLPEPQI